MSTMKRCEHCSSWLLTRPVSVGPVHLCIPCFLRTGGRPQEALDRRWLEAQWIAPASRRDR